MKVKRIRQQDKHKRVIRHKLGFHVMTTCGRLLGRVKWHWLIRSLCHLPSMDLHETFRDTYIGTGLSIKTNVP